VFKVGVLWENLSRLAALEGGRSQDLRRSRYLLKIELERPTNTAGSCCWFRSTLPRLLQENYSATRK